MCGWLVALALALLAVGYLRAFFADDLTGVGLLALAVIPAVAAPFTC